MYKETDQPDCDDWHGRCKALGEPAGEHVLVLRTSFIGLELACKRSLIEWFLAQRGEVPGYRKAIWSGLTAIEVGRLVNMLIRREESLAGLWHVATPPISKFDLLTALNARLGERGVRVVPDDVLCDKSRWFSVSSVATFRHREPNADELPRYPRSLGTEHTELLARRYWANRTGTVLLSRASSGLFYPEMDIALSPGRFRSDMVSNGRTADTVSPPMTNTGIPALGLRHQVLASIARAG
jgi:hypothetical protein